MFYRTTHVNNYTDENTRSTNKFKSRLPSSVRKPLADKSNLAVPKINLFKSRSATKAKSPFKSPSESLYPDYFDDVCSYNMNDDNLELPLPDSEQITMRDVMNFVRTPSTPTPNICNKKFIFEDIPSDLLKWEAEPLVPCDILDIEDVFPSIQF